MSPTIPFPGANHVPIIGQLCTILAQTQAVVAACNCCEAKPMFQIEGVNGLGKCNACGRLYRIAASQYDAATGQGTVSVSCVGFVEASAPDAASPEGAKPS